jgi:hypothetical protein
MMHRQSLVDFQRILGAPTRYCSIITCEEFAAADVLKAERQRGF